MRRAEKRRTFGERALFAEERVVLNEDLLGLVGEDWLNVPLGEEDVFGEPLDVPKVGLLLLFVVSTLYVD